MLREAESRVYEAAEQVAKQITVHKAQKAAMLGSSAPASSKTFMVFRTSLPKRTKRRTYGFDEPQFLQSEMMPIKVMA